MKRKIKMTWEWNRPENVSRWPGNTTFVCNVYGGMKGDHHPGIWLLLIVFGVKLIDCGYYNIYHEDYYETEIPQ